MSVQHISRRSDYEEQDWKVTGSYQIRGFLKADSNAYLESDENDCRRFVKAVLWSTGVARSGVCCRLSMVTGTLFTSAAPAGAMPVSGFGRWRTLRVTRIWKTAFSTAPSCALTRVRKELKEAHPVIKLWGAVVAVLAPRSTSPLMLGNATTASNGKIIQPFTEPAVSPRTK